MTDSPSPEEVEQALREALSARAEDMAPGDSAPWDPYRRRSAVVPLAAEAAARRGVGWRTIAAAVAAIALPVAGGAFLLADNAERTEPPALPACAPLSTTTTTEDPGPPTTAAPSSTAPAAGEPTTALGVQIVESTTTTVPAAPLHTTEEPTSTTTTPTTTTDPCAPQTDCEELPAVAFIGDDPTWVLVGESGQLEIQALAASAADPAWRADATDDVSTGNPSTQLVTTASGGRAVEVIVGELLFVAEGVNIPEAELLAIAATVEPRTPDSLSYTRPCDAVPTTTTSVP